ncbi:hypothetical protein ABH19_04300 [Leptospirillum sp. Group II 'CF-1']|nr:hypothetical protein ABH19_04300 [Leptospirillum sp. Group II 'CF-1']
MPLPGKEAGGIHLREAGDGLLRGERGKPSVVHFVETVPKTPILCRYSGFPLFPVGVVEDFRKARTRGP